MGTELYCRGKAIVVRGEHMNLDTAMGWYLGMDSLPADEIRAKFMGGIDPQIPKIAGKGDILVCGRDFGFGKIHSSFYVALQAIGISCIVAESFSTQMVQTALGRPKVYLCECPNILSHIDMGDEIAVDVEAARIENLTKDVVIEGRKLPPYLIEVMKAGGSFAHLAKRMAERRAFNAA